MQNTARTLQRGLRTATGRISAGTPGLGAVLAVRRVQVTGPAASVTVTRSSSTGANNPQDLVTHTGQQWDKKDYRMARFELAPKQVNPNWAIDMIAEIPPQKTNKRVVWCDGGSGPEGHPRVYINLDKPGNHSCGYCGLRFEKEDHHH